MKSITTLILLFFTATLFAQSDVHPMLILSNDGIVKSDVAWNTHGGGYYNHIIIHADGTAPKPCEYLVNNPCVYRPASILPQNNDTLIVPIGKYKFIKVGDKVYKITSSLEEVEQGGFHGLLQSGIDTMQTWRNPIYLPNRTLQMPNYYN